MSEVTITPFLLALDFVQNAVDPTALNEYMKQNYKKEVIFLNGMDFLDSGGRVSKSETKSDRKSRHDGSSAVAKGIKTKIDADVTKLLDAKKKAIAASEKAAAKTKDGAPKSGKKGKSPADSKPNAPFDGLIDVLYLIQNYPYLGNQVVDMENAGYPIDAFFAIIPEAGAEVTPYTKKLEKSGRVQQKKTIPGCDLDYTNNPNCYPPARWPLIRPSVSKKVAFLDVKVPSDVESAFKEIEKAIISVVQSREQFNEQFQNRKFVEIPSIVPNLTYDNFIDYLSSHAEDYTNGLYIQLQAHKFRTTKPSPPPTIAEMYEELFNLELQTLNRKVVVADKKEVPDPIFNLDSPSSVLPLIYKLKKWKFTQENAAACSAVTSFVTTPTNQYAYAGTKFDQMIASVNKKYQLGLPNSFFDWSQWNISCEYQTVVEEVQDAISQASIVETYLDDQLGVLFLLTLAPVSKTNGHILSSYNMPQMISDLGEYMNLFLTAPQQETKKGRGPQSPAAVIKAKEDPLCLLPSIPSRFAKQDNLIYRLPLTQTNAEKFSSSYVFKSNMRIEITRDILPSGITFGSHIFFKDLFSIVSLKERTVFTVVEGLKILIEPPFRVTILFLEQSIYYDGRDLVCKSSNENAMIIAEDNSFILKDDEGRPTIAYPNGTIARYENDRWSCVDVEGIAYRKNENGELEKLDIPHGKITDVATHTDYHIRPDEIEYYIEADGSRKIMFRLNFTIDQKPDRMQFDIPNFPIIQSSDGTKSMDINVCNVTFKGESATVTCAEYKLSITPECINIAHNEADIYITPTRIEIKTDNQVLVADEDGTERLGEVPAEPPKKKVEIVKSRFGDVYPIKETLLEPQLNDLYHIFVPRFFYIRDDLSATEFLRQDVLPPVEKENRSTLLHPSGCECKILTRHTMNEEQIPRIYIERSPLSKPERANIMKGLHIPKPNANKKKEKKVENVGMGDIDSQEDNSMMEAETVRQSILYDTRVFTQALANCLDRAHQSFLNDNTPEPEVVEDKPPIPPVTPNPRILIMQYNKYRNNLQSFWDAPEGTFSMPAETHEHSPRPQSPRMALFDPPRFFDSKEGDIPPETEEDPKPSSPRNKQLTRSTSNGSSKGITRPRTLSTNTSAIAFGRVKANNPAKFSMAVTNSGTTPLHYTVTSPKNPLLKVLTPPGVVYPGLKMNLEVELLPGSPQEIIDSLVIKTPLFQMPIPITATIVDE